MNYTHIYGFLLAGAICCTGTVASAQNDSEGQEKQKGWLSASFETNSIIYRKDAKSNADYPKDHIGSNNYLKVDYSKGRFSTGIQLESYLPALAGYPSDLNGTKLTNLYAQWADRDFTITGGTFYEQFGSGLLFRVWEDRMLGMNNALLGARATYSYKNMVNIKVVWGTPRLGMTYDSGTQVRGADLSIGLAEIFGWQDSRLYLEGSVLNRYESLSAVLQEVINPNKTGYSGRINFEKSGFTVKAEYVDNGTNYFYQSVAGTDQEYWEKKGNAQLFEVGYNNRGLGIFLSGRRLEWMQSQIDRNNSSITNMLNYIPAMCVQYTYMLTNLEPYTPQIGGGAIAPNGNAISGELGGQADIYYLIRKGTAVGGRRGLKLHANFATYYALEDGKGNLASQNLLFRDLNVDAERWFGRNFKASLLYSWQTKNPSYGAMPETISAHVIVGDFLYKFNSEYSLRMELQYLLSKDMTHYKGDWMAGLLEFNVAPKWSVYVSDMYNNGGTKLHYYNAGVSFAQSHTRLQLSYGRNKDGYVCSGGVCRVMPAYTGFNFAMTISF